MHPAGPVAGRGGFGRRRNLLSRLTLAHATPMAGQTVPIDADDIGGVVTGAAPDTQPAALGGAYSCA